MFLVLLLLFIILAFYILKKQTKNFSYLLWFTLIYWVINIIISLFIFNDYEWCYLGLIWIILACIMFIVIYEFTYNNIKIKNDEDEKVSSGIDLKIANIFLCISFGLALIYVNMLIYSLGFSSFDLFSFEKILEMNKVASDIRYSGEENHSLFMQAFLVFVYASVLIGGYSINYQDKKLKKILCLLTILPLLLILLIENTKATILSGVILWVSAFLVGYLEKHKKFPKISLKKVGIALGIGGALIVIIIISMFLRIGSINQKTFVEVFYKFFNYAFGHIPAFDYWFYNYADDLTYTFGQYTFLGLFNFFGFRTRVLGVYIEKLQTGIINTNIYTANRGIINDFGLVGGLIFYALLGALAAICYKCVTEKKESHELSTTILTAIFAFITYSLLVSLFTYLSYIVAFGVFFIYLIIINKGKALSFLFRKRVKNE